MLTGENIFKNKEIFTILYPFKILLKFITQHLLQNFYFIFYNLDNICLEREKPIVF